MWIGWLEFDLLLGDVRSLKQKRSAIRPVIAELQRRFAVSAAETGSQDLHRRANIGLAVVSADRAHVVEVLDAAERMVAARPEVELLSASARTAAQRATTKMGGEKKQGGRPPYMFWGEVSRLRRNGVGVTAPGANLRALIKKAVCPRMLCCGRTASPTTYQPRWMVSHARGSVQHCCSRSASTVRDNWVTVAT